MDTENIEKVWTEMRKHFEWMKVTLESLPEEEKEVLAEMADEWFAAHPLE